MMSWKAIRWVWDQKLKGPEKWVLTGIANYYDPDSSEPARPSLEVLSKRLGMTTRNVQRNIAKLVKRKLLRKVRDHHYGNNIYILNMPKTDDKKSPVQVTNCHVKQVTNLPPILSGESDKNILKTKRGTALETKIEEKRKAPPWGDEFERTCKAERERQERLAKEEKITWISKSVH